MPYDPTAAGEDLLPSGPQKEARVPTSELSAALLSICAGFESQC